MSSSSSCLLPTLGGGVFKMIMLNLSHVNYRLRTGVRVELLICSGPHHVMPFQVRQCLPRECNNNDNMLAKCKSVRRGAYNLFITKCDRKAVYSRRAGPFAIFTFVLHTGTLIFGFSPSIIPFLARFISLSRAQLPLQTGVHATERGVKCITMFFLVVVALTRQRVLRSHKMA